MSKQRTSISIEEKYKIIKIIEKKTATKQQIMKHRFLGQLMLDTAGAAAGTVPQVTSTVKEVYVN